MYIKDGHILLVGLYVISSMSKSVVAKFDPKYDGPYTIIEIIRFQTMKDGRIQAVYIDQVRVY